VRIVAEGFEPSARFRRVIKTNADVKGEVRPARATPEQYALFKRYLDARHAGGGMTQMNFIDYEYMVEDTPVQSILVEYRLVGDPQKRLVAVALTDVMPNGLSMVYSFYDPALRHRGLGNFLILDHVQQVKSTGLDYVYLGYWVKDSPKMAYKKLFHPLEVQTSSLGWRPLEI
jgi:arginyl-tRNA--protein-N-Asp/Glu arginylyltransferase